MRSHIPRWNGFGTLQRVRDRVVGARVYGQRGDDEDREGDAVEHPLHVLPPNPSADLGEGEQEF